LEYVVSCPSDLAWHLPVLSSGSSTDSGPTPDMKNPMLILQYTVVLTGQWWLGKLITVSDGFAGSVILYGYDIYGISW